MEGVEVPVIEAELVQTRLSFAVLGGRRAREGQRAQPGWALEGQGAYPGVGFGRAAPPPQVGLVCERESGLGSRALSGKLCSGPSKVERQEYLPEGRNDSPPLLRGSIFSRGNDSDPTGVSAEVHLQTRQLLCDPHPALPESVPIAQVAKVMHCLVSLWICGAGGRSSEALPCTWISGPVHVCEKYCLNAGAVRNLSTLLLRNLLWRPADGKCHDWEENE